MSSLCAELDEKVLFGEPPPAEGAELVAVIGVRAPLQSHSLNWCFYTEAADKTV